MLTAAFVFADCLGDDILCPFQSRLSVLNITFDKALCGTLRVPFALSHQDLSQRFKPLFSSHLCSGTTLGLIWQIDVLQLRRIPTVVDALLQLGRHLLQVGDGLGHRLLTFLYLFQLVVTVADGGNLHLVESTRTLLPIT